MSLRARSDIRRVHRIGSRTRSGGVTIVTADGTSGPPRVAIVAGRRVGGAVARNRAKRRLREAVDRAPIHDGREYIVIAHEAVLTAPFDRLVAWVADALAGS